MKYKKEIRIFMDSMGYDLERQRTHLVFRHYVGFTYTAPSSPSCPHAMNQVRRGVRRQLIDKGIRS